jgi:hypothetical protein
MASNFCVSLLGAFVEMYFVFALSSTNSECLKIIKDNLRKNINYTGVEAKQEHEC